MTTRTQQTIRETATGVCIGIAAAGVLAALALVAFAVVVALQ